MSGGAVVGHPEDEGFGYGPPRYVSPGDVALAAAALEQYGEDGIRSRFDLDAMLRAELYGVNPDTDSAEQEVDAVLTAYRAVREFWRRAAEARQGMVLAMG